MKKGFTLAEVLITLTIIGVVAALTIPGLIASYQKKVVETRIKKFYSVIQQAIKMIEANGSTLDATGYGSAGGTDKALKYWEQLSPYIKSTEVRNTGKGATVGFADGSGMYMWGPSGAAEIVRLGFCPQYRDCKTIDEAKVTFETLADGKKVFYFYSSNGQPPTDGWDGKNRDFLLNYCGGSVPRYCSTLIWFDGWKIKDDYPW
jgi:prepilin-type N-terminal cleavage/methylation domain-containing protein